MTLRDKLMHYTYDLDCGSDLKQEAITAIESIVQYMDEDELLHHSRPLALAYLALTEDVSTPVVHGRWERTSDGAARCTACKRKMNPSQYGYAFCSLCGAKMDGGATNAVD